MTPKIETCRAAVVAARTAYQQGTGTREAMEQAADAYIAAMGERFRALWPTKRFRHPSRAYLLRAL